MNRKSCALGALLTLGLCCVAFAAPETPVAVNGEGSAIGLGPAARSEAVKDAQTALILDRLEKIAPSRDFSVFTSLLQVAPSYYQSYKITKETKTDDSTHVEIEGQLLERRLKQDIAAVVMGQNFITPRVLIIACEHLVAGQEPDTSTPGIIEKKLHEELKKVQFDLVPSDVLRAKVPAEKIAGYATGDAEAAAMLARGMLADLVILGDGTTTIEPDPTAANLERARAEVTLRVVRAIDGFVIDAPKNESLVHSVNPREGSAQAIEDGCEKLLGDVKTAVALGALGGSPQDSLLLTVEGLSDDKQVEELCATLKKALLADKAEVVFKQDGATRLRVNYDGPVGVLIDQLPMLGFSGGTLKLKTAVDRDLVMTVGK